MPLSQEQLHNAGIIFQVGRTMGLGNRDIQIALIAAMTESNLINVNYGDRDSLGLFQQRPSQGWGSPEDVLNPTYAARKFFSGLVGLGKQRFQMDMGAAAQAVQRSAYPDRYATHLGAIRAAYPAIQKASGLPPQSMDGGDYDTGPSLQDVIPQVPLQQPVRQSTPTEAQMLGVSGSVDPGIPSASTMLGAWGMSSPQPIDVSEIEATLTNGAGSFLSEGTNQRVLTNLETTLDVPYQKGVDGWRKGVISAARTALGNPYVWGGTSLTSGVDCSGLVQAAFAKVGINMPRISYQQANYGQRVGLSGLQPGDLVAWDNSSRNNGADHIAIYLGNGMIIESPRPGLSTRIRKLGSGLEGGWGVHLNFGKSNA